jgi:predicted NAD-dependent protein-ADP-ribosyltransferase YbiA (DUF1768 family)
MDIGSKHGYPASALSNFAPHPFTIDGVQCNSMEGFLQGLKFKNPEMQKYVCTLVGFKAKSKGKDKNWYVSQTLWWQGKELDRHGLEYQELLDKAYACMFEQSEGFRKALKAAGDAVLTHSMGKSDSHRTILTVQEFCKRLMALRSKLRE